MRVASESDRRDVPRWALWLVAVICFGPSALTWVLGVLSMPIWIGMLTAVLAQPERFAHDPSATPWVAALPIGLVIGGLTFTVLPLAGTALLLAKSWRFLLASSVRSDVESRRSRRRREHRDDWRLDA